jgi:hypothetical protein
MAAIVRTWIYRLLADPRERGSSSSDTFCGGSARHFATSNGLINEWREM